MPETWGQKQDRLRSGNYVVGDLVAQDYKINFGFFHKVNINSSTAEKLIGKEAMEELLMAPKILQIIFVDDKIMEGVQYKEGKWSIWTRKLRTLKPGDKGTPEWLCEVCGEPKCYGCS